MNKSDLIYVSGHTGFVGSKVLSKLKNLGYSNIITKSHSELDLMNSEDVFNFFKLESPKYVIHCAARVGGIKANIDFPAEFLYENLQIQNNVIWASKVTKVKKLLFLASAVVYPNDCPQPIKEGYFMKGEPDPTKTGYAYAKIAGVKLCEYINEEFGLNFISCMPTNLYGEGDNFNPNSAHVIPALIQRMHNAKLTKAKQVEIWGSGNAKREFLFIDDFIDAIIWLMKNYNEKLFLNIGTGKDISMKELAENIKKIVGYNGELIFNKTKPEGMHRRLFDVSKINKLGWSYKIEIDQGLKRTYKWYLDSKNNI